MAAVSLAQPNSSRTNPSLQGGDDLRVLATVAVIMIHVATRVMEQKPDPSTVAWWSANLAFAVSRWSVPVFVLLSGALLLDPTKYETTTLFYQKRLRRIGIPLVIWSMGYLLLDHCVGEPVRLRDLVWRVMMGTPYYHLWFVYMIAGLYLVTPLLKTFVQHASNTQRWLLVLLLLVMTTTRDGFEMLTLEDEPPFIFTRFVPYLGYYLCGYQLRTFRSSIRKAWPLIGISVICIALIGIGSYVIMRLDGWHRSHYLYGYHSPLVILLSLAVFTLVIRFGPSIKKSHFVAQWIRHVAPLTLGIYLVHPLVIGILGRLNFAAEAGFAPLRIPLLTGAVFFGSYLIVVVMKRIPFVSQTV